MGRYDITLRERMMQGLAKKMLNNVDIVDRGYSTPCWIWKGWTEDEKHYGQVTVFYQPYGAHCIAYELWVGDIPPGHQIHHECGQPACVNPEHLKAMTAVENIALSYGRSAQLRDRTHCPRGHEFNEANTFWYTNKKTGYTTRMCRPCRAENQQQYKERKLKG